MAKEFTEAGLFDYIKTRYLEDLEMSSDAFEYIDATSQGYRLIIELKCRHTHYDELILEKDKHESLVQQADKLGFTPFYINSTPQGIYAFNLRKIKVTNITVVAAQYCDQCKSWQTGLGGFNVRDVAGEVVMWLCAECRA